MLSREPRGGHEAARIRQCSGLHGGAISISRYFAIADEAMKKRRRIITKPKRPNAPKVVRRRNPSAATADEKIALLEIKLNEALEQQSATSEVLKVISSSPGDLEPVFQAMLENAMRICEAKFGTLYQYDGNEFHLSAVLGAPPALTEFFRQRGAFKPPPGTPRPPLADKRRDPRHRRLGSGNSKPFGPACGREVAYCRAHVQGRRTGWGHRHLPPGGTTVY